MEIEHINDDTIRVTIDNSDLMNRGITFLDLLGNEKQIESFFYGILEEVDLNDDFKDSDAVTFQVMPKNNGLELFISKGANVDEDIINSIARESKQLSSNEKKKSKGEDSKVINDILGQLEDDSNLDDNHIEKTSSMIVAFDNIEKLLVLVTDLDDEFIDSVLYHQNSIYYLYLEFQDLYRTTEAYRKLLFAKVKEYGEESPVSVDVLEEHADVIIEENALSVLKTHF